MKQKYLDFYSLMSRIRFFEERSGQIYTMGKIGGFCHLYIGQEAIAVGICKAAKAIDTIITAYRCRGHYIAVGGCINKAMAELLGKETGASKGKGGSMHVFDVKNNFYGGHGIVGGQVALGTGLAFSHKYLNNNAISIVFMGDGATNQGQVFESFNMAALYGLPVLYVIENNLYGMGTSVSRACAGELYKRGEPFGIKGYKISGDNVIEVNTFFSNLIEEVRQTSFPALVEIDTYRFRGHSMSDPAKYRTKESLSHAKTTRDPIIVLENFLLQNNYASQKELEQIAEEEKILVKKALEFAEQSDFPNPNSLYEDILK